MKLAALLAALSLLLSPLCGCTRDNSLPALSASGASASLSEDEAEALLSFYDSLPQELSPRQRELLEAYRALRDYLKARYPDASWEVELLEPASSFNSGGNEYETFHLTIDGSQAKFQVQKDGSGTWQVIYDSLSGQRRQ